MITTHDMLIIFAPILGVLIPMAIGFALQHYYDA